MAIGDPSFDVFKLSDEHEEMRAVLRELCDKEIAPYAADVDEKARYTTEALAALNASKYNRTPNTWTVLPRSAGAFLTQVSAT